MTTLLLLTAIIGVLSGIIAGIAMLPNPQGALSAATGITLLMGALSVT